nr:uncharacterized protein LOC107129856 [Macaca fascicularis]
MLPPLEHQTPSSSAFALLDLHQWFARASQAFSHRLKAAPLVSLFLRFWDSDWRPCSSACRRPIVRLHLGIIYYFENKMKAMESLRKMYILQTFSEFWNTRNLESTRMNSSFLT